MPDINKYDGRREGPSFFYKPWKLRRFRKLTISVLVFLLVFSNYMTALAADTDPTFKSYKAPVQSYLRLETDPVSGSFLYEYPITIPPGRNGLQPDLKLQYNNQSSDIYSIFGKGWSINIPYINRIPRKGVDRLYTENYFNSSLSGELEKVEEGEMTMAMSDEGEKLYIATDAKDLGSQEDEGENLVDMAKDFLGIDSMPANLKLKVDKNKILASHDIDWIVEKDDGSYENKGKIKKYLYASEVKVPRAKYNGFREDLSKRTKNAQFFSGGIRDDGREKWTAKFYPGEPFYQDPGTKVWYQTETATTTIESFEKQTKISLWDGFKELIFGKAAYADTTTVYSGAGDGYVQYYTNSNWDTVHDATSGTEAYDSMNTFYCCNSYVSNNYTIKRGFYPVDTSAIDDGTTINSATFNIYVQSTSNPDNDGDDWINLVQTTQASSTSLVVDDYDNAGSVDNPTEGATRVDITNISSGQYTALTLNSTGLSWINKTGYTKLGLREGHDAIDSPIGSGYTNVQHSLSEYTGTGQDPYLEINYTANTLAPLDGDTYGSKVDNGEFLKYTFSEDNKWQARDKNGLIYKFGYSTSTRQYDGGEINKWMIEEIRDTNNNYIKYEYYKDSGQIYPYKIIYTGHDSTDGPFEVEFTRESRDDDGISFATGFEVQTSYRISEIQIKIDGAWVRKYELGYTAGDNGKMSLLDTITETGQDEESNTLSLPATDFRYQGKATGEKSWTQDNNYTIPLPFTSSASGDHGDIGTRLGDVNGDGLVDIIQSYRRITTGGNDDTQVVYINNGDGTGWTEDPNYSIPVFIIEYNYVTNTLVDQGVRLADVNGDGLIDLVRSTYFQYSSTKAVYINNGDGTGWTEDPNYSIPIYFLDGVPKDTGAMIDDVNGDGLPDLLLHHQGTDNKIYLNDGDGTGWTLTNYAMPNGTYFINSSETPEPVRLADVNGDGLVDILKSETIVENGAVYINNGDGTGWTEDTNYSIPIHFGTTEDLGIRLFDVNGDGLADILKAHYDSHVPEITEAVYINDGDGTGWTEDTDYSIATYFVLDGYDRGVRLADANGDGLLDILFCADSDGGINENFYQADGKKIEQLNSIKHNKGAETNIVYKGSAEYLDLSSNLLNPTLPMSMQTVYQIGINDGLGNHATTTYEYAGGDYYFNNPYDHKFSGFATTTAINPFGYITKTFYHQGNDTASSTGEYIDDISKLGKIYRNEIYDDSNNLYSQTINKWEHYDLGDDRDFVKLVRSVDFSYDGDDDHKDKAQTFIYDNSTGNSLGSINWGEVTGANDGSFTDIGTDTASSTITYAASTTPYVIGLPSSKTLYDYNGNKVQETKYYYDTLNLGNVDKGNLTKEENWVTGTTYIDTEKTYNSYGLVTQEKDPRDKATNFTYDAHNLYVATSTNPLSQVTNYYYDYSLGKPKKVVDPNGLAQETVYDGLDRILQVKQPDLTTPSTLVVKTAYTYTDNVTPRVVQQTNYLDSSTDFNIYTYLDGLDRPVQTRKEAEDSNTYETKDFVYNKVGLSEKESLPYFSTGASSTAITANDQLFTVYSYDPLQRPITIATTVGTTTNAYDQWQLTVTDAEGNTKDLYKDAFDNLVQVNEHNSTSTYTTEYEYNLLGNLTKITDALDNVRNFTYNGLGRRLTAEDLHATGDSYFGTWTYTYDNTGNLTSKVDPKSQTAEYTYDDINRVLTENYTGAAGTEISYGYDSCTYGIGHLCSATTTDVVATYNYNSLGLVSNEKKTLNSKNYVTDYDYGRQGNITLLTYPDNLEVKYEYNTAGLLEKVSKKANGDGDYIYVIDDFDYSPMGQISYIAYANGISTTNTYDADELYRLRNKLTEKTGGLGMSLFSEDTTSDIPVFVEEAKTETEDSGLAIDNEPMDNTEVIVETPPVESLSTEPATSGEATIETPTSTEPIESVGEIVEDEEVSDGNILSDTVDFVKDLLGIDTVADNLKLKAPKDKILASHDTDWIIYHKDTNTWENKGKIKKYLYASNVEVGPSDYDGLSEEISKRTKNTQFFHKGGDEWVAKIYAGEPFYKNPSDGKWYQTETATTTIEAFNKQTEISLWDGAKEMILGRPAYADTGTVYSGAGDGVVASSQNANWNTVHDLSSGTLYGTSPEQWLALANQAKPDSGYDSKYQLYRGFFPINTSSLDDGVTITAANFYFYIYSGEVHYGDNDSQAYLRLVNTTQADTTALAADDFDQCGAVDNPTAGATDLDLDGLSAGAYNYFNLNSTGRGWVSKTGYTKLGMREGHDAEDTPIVYQGSGTYTMDGVYGYFSEQTGTNYDPYISITYFSNHAPSQPDYLLTEGSSNPVSVSDQTPEFSAIYTDEDDGDLATHYQIQVATSTTSWDTAIWNSGKTALASSTLEGTRIADISYGGDSLDTDGSTYHWRIKFWDDDDAEGSWSTGNDYFTMADTSSGDLTLQDLTYTYDHVGNITRIVDASDTDTYKTIDFVYDDLYRLITASTTNATTTDFLETYSYNALGNILNKSDVGDYLYQGDTGTSYANPHAVTSVNGDTYSYDNNGNLTSDSTWTHTWDYQNRLIESDDGVSDISYAYDHTGQRVAYDNGLSVTYYPNKYYNISNATTTEHIYAGGLLVATIEGNGTATSTQYIHTDHLTGSNVVTDDDGEILQVIDYYPFGEIRINDKTGDFDEQRKFTGHEYDEETDLTYANARYYSGNIGRFISQDAWEGDLFNPQSLNKYTYAFNNPLLFVDPTGESGQLTINVQKGGFLGGHAWVTYTSDQTGETTSYGTWGNNPEGRGNGLLINYELDKNISSDSSRTEYIDDAHEADLYKTIQSYEDKGEDAWKPFSPCSAFAQDAWEAGTDEYLDANTSIINHPYKLNKSIIEANGGQSTNAPQIKANNGSSSSNSSSSSSFGSSSNSSSRSYYSYRESGQKSVRSEGGSSNSSIAPLFFKFTNN